MTALAVGLGLLASGARPAEAQVVRGVFGPRTFVGPGGPVALTPGYGVAPSTTLYSSYSSAYVPAGAVVKPYSYYVLPPSIPSREYVGPAAFPFYGKPYGHVYDRWTWPYMSDPSASVLNRYYYPPLGF
jgi:hypothetical protein